MLIARVTDPPVTDAALSNTQLVSDDVVSPAGSFVSETVIYPGGARVLGGGAGVIHAVGPDFGTVLRGSRKNVVLNLKLQSCFFRNGETIFVEIDLGS